GSGALWAVSLMVVSSLCLFLLRIASCRPAFARDGPPPDVTAAETFRPVYEIDGAVGGCLRLGHRLAGCRHVEHAPPRRAYPSVVGARARMENLHMIERARTVESANVGTLDVFAGIAFRGHDDCERRIVFPFERDAVERAVMGGDERGQ